MYILKKIGIVVIVMLLLCSTLVAAGLWEKLTGDVISDSPNTKVKTSLWSRIFKNSDDGKEKSKVIMPWEKDPEKIQTGGLDKITKPVLAEKSMSVEEFLFMLKTCEFKQSKLCCALPGAKSKIEPTMDVTGAAIGSLEFRNQFSYAEILLMLNKCDYTENELCCTLPPGLRVGQTLEKQAIKGIQLKESALTNQGGCAESPNSGNNKDCEAMKLAELNIESNPVMDDGEHGNGLII